MMLEYTLDQQKYMRFIIAILLILKSWGQQIDERNVSAGKTIGNLSFGYADQPQCIVRENNAWICTVTHNPSHEGGAGEAVYVTSSNDEGETWTKPMPLEKVFKEQYAYSTLFESKFTFNDSKFTRLYVIYVQNYQNITTLPNGQKLAREDMMGGFFLKYSDNNGKTWSEKSYQIPVRKTKIDYANQWNGSTQLLWLVDKGFQHNNAAYVAFTKIGQYLVTPPTSSWIIYSPNLAIAKTIEDIEWKILPDDDDGIRSYTDDDVANGCGVDGVGNNQCISSEPHIQPIGNNNNNGDKDDVAKHVYVVFRTDGGFLGASVSHDFGNSFGNIQPSNLPMALHRIEKYSAADIQDHGKPRPLKNPRGPITPRRLYGLNSSDGTADFLMLFYNNGNIPIFPHLGSWLHRNPYWLVPGWIIKSQDSKGPSQVEWGEAEIGLYVPTTTTNATERGSGYPDFIIKPNNNNNNNNILPTVWITETQKVYARVHKINDDLLHDLIYQKILNKDVTKGIMATILKSEKGKTITFPKFPSLQQNQMKIGMAFVILFDGIEKGMNATIFDTHRDDDTISTMSKKRSENGSGVSIKVNNGIMELLLSDKANNSTFKMVLDKQCNDWLYYVTNNANKEQQHYLSFNIDGSSRVITVMVDGVLCDGGQQKWKVHPEPGDTFQGWSFFPMELVNVNAAVNDDGNNIAKIAIDYPFNFKEIRWYNRFLRTGEMLSLWRYMV